MTEMIRVPLSALMLLVLFAGLLTAHDELDDFKLRKKVYDDHAAIASDTSFSKHDRAQAIQIIVNIAIGQPANHTENLTEKAADLLIGFIDSQDSRDMALPSIAGLEQIVNGAPGNLKASNLLNVFQKLGAAAINSSSGVLIQRAAASALSKIAAENANRNELTLADFDPLTGELKTVALASTADTVVRLTATAALAGPGNPDLQIPAIQEIALATRTIPLLQLVATNSLIGKGNSYLSELAKVSTTASALSAAEKEKAAAENVSAASALEAAVKKAAEVVAKDAMDKAKAAFEAKPGDAVLAKAFADTVKPYNDAVAAAVVAAKKSDDDNKTLIAVTAATAKAAIEAQFAAGRQPKMEKALREVIAAINEVVKSSPTPLVNDVAANAIRMFLANKPTTPGLPAPVVATSPTTPAMQSGNTPVQTETSVKGGLTIVRLTPPSNEALMGQPLAASSQPTAADRLGVSVTRTYDPARDAYRVKRTHFPKDRYPSTPVAERAVGAGGAEFAPTTPPGGEGG